MESMSPFTLSKVVSARTRTPNIAATPAHTPAIVPFMAVSRPGGAPATLALRAPSVVPPRLCLFQKAEGRQSLHSPAQILKTYR